MTNDDSQLRREIEDRVRLIASSRVELKEFRTSFDEQKLDKVHDQLDSSKRALESKNRTISRLKRENLRLAENEKWLRQKMEDGDRLLVSSQSALQQLREELQLLLNDLQLRRDTGLLWLTSKLAMEELQLSLNNKTERVEQLLDQMRTLIDQEKDDALRKLTEMLNNKC